MPAPLPVVNFFENWREKKLQHLKIGNFGNVKRGLVVMVLLMIVRVAIKGEQQLHLDQVMEHIRDGFL